MNYLLKTSLITGLLVVAFQSSVSADDSNKEAIEPSITKAKYILPPPSPFFSSKITSYTTHESEETEVTSIESVTKESSVQELKMALKIKQEQASILLEELHATAKNSDFENEMYEKTVNLLQEKIKKIDDENKALKSKLSANKSVAAEQQSLLSTLKQDSSELNDLKNSYEQRKEEVSALKQQISYFEVIREKSNATDAKVKTLEDAYTVKSNEVKELKTNLSGIETSSRKLQEKIEEQNIELVSLQKKLIIEDQTQAELIDLQDSVAESNESNVLLKAKIVELDDTNKSLKSQLDKMQQDASQQTQKLSLLDQSTAELEALKSAYTERNDETTNLKEELLEIDNANKSLFAEILTMKAEASQNTRKLGLMDQSTAELTALKSAYKDRNDEMESLKTKLIETEDSNKSLLAEIEKMKADASKNNQKLGLLDQSTTELAALKSAYEERNEEVATVKDFLSASEESNNTLLAEIEAMKKEATTNNKKLGLLDQSTTELTALKSAYKDRNDEMESLKTKLIETEDSNKSLLSTIETIKAEASQNNQKLSLLDQSIAELTALKSAYKERNDEAATLKGKLLEIEDSNKSLLSTIETLKADASQNTRKLGLLDQSTTELTALKSAYKDRNDEAAILKESVLSLENLNKTLQSKIEELENAAKLNTQKLGLLDQSTSELMALKKKISDADKNNQVLTDQLSQLQTNNISLQEKITATEKLLPELDESKSALISLQKKLTETKKLKDTLSNKINVLESDSSKQKKQLSILLSASQELESLKKAYKNLKDEKLTISNEYTAAMLDSDKDGVVNKLDQCKSSPLGSSVDNIGCPEISDADGDNIPDANDLCANTLANVTVNKFGCAADKNITLEGVNFATGSDQLTASSLSIINTVANVLKANPSIKVEVAGHTDGLGIKSVNQKLSKRRANSVAVQLIEQGISADRISSKGYGETNPIAPNTNDAGRLKNRRVELIIR